MMQQYADEKHQLLYFRCYQHYFHLILTKTLCVRRLLTGRWILTTC